MKRRTKGEDTEIIVDVFERLAESGKNEFALGDGKNTVLAREVWAALNDVEVLKQSITGCETLVKTGYNQLEAVVTAKVGYPRGRCLPKSLPSWQI